MPRGPRICYPDAVLHVINRFVDRHPFFRSQNDRDQFLDSYFETADTFQIRTFAYHLMPNHFHFVVQTPSGEVSRFLQRFLTRAVQQLNRAHRRTGHLLQGRTKTLLVETDDYFDTVIAYVLTNGVRAGLFQSIFDDTYSSTSELLAKENSRIAKESLWPMLFGRDFDAQNPTAESRYVRQWLRRLDADATAKKFKEGHRGSFLGSSEFRRQILDEAERRKAHQAGKRGRKSDRPERKRKWEWKELKSSVRNYVQDCSASPSWRNNESATAHISWYIAITKLGWTYGELRERAGLAGVQHSTFTNAISEIRRSPQKSAFAEKATDTVLK